MSRPRYRVERLAWTDHDIADIALPGARLRITLGLGSGLSRRPGDPPGRLWSISDRGPNLKVPLAVERYGLDHLAALADIDGVKILPLTEGGPTLSELQIDGDAVRLIQVLPLTSGRTPISGRPPAGDEAVMEPAFGLDGQRLANDPDGADTEGLAAMPDGTFWVGEEYGPSLIHLDATGAVLERWTPKGILLAGSRAPVRDLLPAAARRRRLNRGFEAIAASPDGKRLAIGLQSALVDADEGSAPLWLLDARTGERLAEHLYPFDDPQAFERDRELGKVRRRDLKICDLAWIDGERLLVLERISQSTKVYRVDLDDRRLRKTLVLDTDDEPDIVGDLEGLALIDPHTMILVNDNDFGVEGVETAFFRITFAEPL
jgi:hypothetical protein